MDETISCLGKRLKEATKEDSHDAFGRYVAHKLRTVQNDQRIFLEKVINEAIFEAELGNLNRNCSIHIPAPTVSNMALNPPRISLPGNLMSSQTAMMPESHTITLQSDGVNLESNDYVAVDSSLSQYIVNFK